jgi:hypothetical protein
MCSFDGILIVIEMNNIKILMPMIESIRKRLTSLIDNHLQVI